MGQDGFAFAVVVGVVAYDGPVVDPRDGLQVEDAAVGEDFLEVDEPILVCGGGDPAA